MKNFKKISREQLRLIVGGVEMAVMSNCSADCGVSITNCNGTCSATEKSVTCKGKTQTLTKTCN